MAENIINTHVQNVFALRIVNLLCDEDTQSDAWLDCGNMRVFDLIVGKNNDKYVTVKVSATIVNVDLNKRIGTHNNIKIRLKIVAEKNSSSGNVTVDVSLLKKALLRREVELKALVNKEYCTVAEKYYIFGVRPVFKRAASTFFVDLDIYSWDKLMDITRNTRMYVDSPLGGGIMNGENGFMTKYQNAPKCVTSGMRVLQVEKEDSGSKKKEMVELRIPYLDQYDETDYNFVLRLANQCGEFFYFENGVINLGLTRIMKTDLGSKDEEVVTEIKDYAAAELLSEEEYDEESVADFFKDAYDDKTSESSGLVPKSGRYRLGVPNGGSEGQETDVWIKLKDEQKKEEINKAKEELYPHPALRVFARFFQSETLISFLLSNLTEEKAIDNSTTAIVEGYEKTLESEKDSFQTIYKEGTDIFSQKQTSGIKNTETSEWQHVLDDYTPDYKLFVAARRAEMIIANNQYRIIFDDRQMNLKLGDIVTCEGIEKDRKFVVVDVHSEFNAVTSENIHNRMEVIVVPVINESPIPLPADFEPKKRNEPAVGSNSTNPVTVSNGVFTQMSIRLAQVKTSNDPKRLNRVKVKFLDVNEDNKDKVSTWMSVLTPFATNNGSGIMSKLNEGDYVLVAWNVPTKKGVLESFVIGSVYYPTQDNKYDPPFGQRKYSTVIRSNNGQVIAFNDKKDAGNTILTSFLPFLKFFSFIPKLYNRLATLKPASKEIQRAMGAIEITDYYGLFSITGSSDQRSINIESPFGTVGISAAMGITVSAPNGNVKIVGKNVDIVAGNNLTLKSGANIDKSLLTCIGSDFLGKVGKSAKKQLPEGVLALFDLSALRFAVETFLKPVEGTLQIHSGRYLMLESGDGSASLPKGAMQFGDYKYNPTPLVHIGGKEIEVGGYIKTKVALIQAAVSIVNSYKNACITSCNDIYSKRNGIEKYISEQQGLKENLKVSNVMDSWLSAVGLATPEDVKKDLFPDNIKFDTNTIVDKIRQDLSKLRASIRDYNNKEWGDSIFPNESRDYNYNFVKNLKVNLQSLRKIDLKYHGEPQINEIFNEKPDDTFMIALRKALQTIIEQKVRIDGKQNKEVTILNFDNSKLKTYSDEEWREYVESIEYIDQDEHLEKNGAMSVLYNLLPIGSFRDSWRSWSAESKSAILMSKEKGTTYTVDGQTIKVSSVASINDVRDAALTATLSNN